MAYTTGDVLVRAVMTAASGLPADATINDFAFQVVGGPADATTLANAMTCVSDFYRAVQANGHAVGAFISNQVNRGATHELQAWVITAPPMGSPDLTQSWLGPPTTSDTDGEPPEVAGVLSFHADYAGSLEEVGSTRPRARRRGRVFIGPLNRDAIVHTVPPYYLAPVFTETLNQAAVALKDEAETFGFFWSVWSRADATLRHITEGWTDNAPDTQRRRGPNATVRTVWGP
jgi:hypothetical protein